MEIATIVKSVSNLLEADLIGDAITILWHAGEPLTLPVSYYRSAFAAIRGIVPALTVITHSFQTNGLLINEEWCDLINEYGLEIGVSLDGFDILHNEYRRTWNNKETFHLVIKAINVMKSKKININIISVVTKSTLSYAADFYNFFLNMGINSIGLNIEEIEGANNASSFAGNGGGLDESKKQVKIFLEEVYKLHLVNNRPFKIREFIWAENKIARADLNPKNLIFTQLTDTYRTITIAYNGNFSTFSPELIINQSPIYGDFILGNVWNTGFIEALNMPKFILINQDLILGLEKCKQTCDYYGLCSGGTPSNKVSEHGTLNCSVTQYCKLAFQAPIDVVLSYLQDA